MTTVTEKERFRAAFNHDWIKNRFILTLHRARQVAAGRLRDESMGTDLEAVIAEWPARVASVLPLFADDSQLDSWMAEIHELLPGAPPELVHWLAAMEMRLNGYSSSSDHAGIRARQAVEELDQEILRARDDARVLFGLKGFQPKAELRLQRLLESASRVSQAFSELRPKTKTENHSRL